MNTTDMIALLGKPANDPGVARLLAAYKMKARDGSASNRAMGIELGLERAGLLDVAPRGVKPNTRVLSTVFLWTDKATWAGNVKTFTGALPHGLKFGMSRQAVDALLGPPGNARAERWDFSDHCIFGWFKPDLVADKLVEVSWGLRPESFGA